MKKIVLVSAFLLCIAASFAYGVGVGKYNWFPYSMLLNYKNIVLFGGDGQVDELGRVVAFPGKKVIDCPAQTERLGVLLAIGQSNAANSLERMFSASEVPDVLNFFNGHCYEASSPLLGATNVRGEFISALGQKLVDKKIYDKVVVLSSAVGLSSSAQWVKGADLNSTLMAAVKDLSRQFRVTDVVWHQGEADGVNRMLKDVYKINFLSLKTSLNEAGVHAPFFIATASKCSHIDGVSGQIPQAQAELAAENADVIMAVNTDELIPFELRFDGCHFGAEAQQLVAREYSNAIAIFRATQR